MKQFHGLMMAKSLDECRAHFPKVDGQIGAGSLDQLRVLMSRFTIVGKKPELSGGGLVDIGRTGMVRGVTEQTEFVLSLSGVHLGDLGGIRARSSTFMRPLTERQRNARDAMRLLLGIPAYDHSTATNTAFDNGASATQVNFEEELENVIDSGLVTPVDVPEVVEFNPTNWADSTISHQPRPTWMLHLRRMRRTH